MIFVYRKLCQKHFFQRLVSSRFKHVCKIQLTCATRVQSFRRCNNYEVYASFLLVFERCMQKIRFLMHMRKTLICVKYLLKNCLKNFSFDDFECFSLSSNNVFLFLIISINVHAKRIRTNNLIFFNYCYSFFFKLGTFF